MREKICSRLSASRSRRGPTKKVDAFPRLKQQRGMRQEIQERGKTRGIHFSGPLLCSYVSSRSPSSRFPSRLRGWLRLSLPLSLRWPIGPRRRHPASQRPLRPLRAADIPTPLPSQDTVKEVSVMSTGSSSSASLALDACAIASALAPQRFLLTAATAAALPWRSA